MPGTIACPVGCRHGTIGVRYVCFLCNGTGAVSASVADLLPDGERYRQELRDQRRTLAEECERLRVTGRTLLHVLYGVLPRSELAKRRGECYITTGRELAARQQATPARKTGRKKKPDTETLW
jgi:hypothetical protein